MAIFILHFQPIELYPPIQNILYELQNKSNKKIIVITTKSSLINNIYSTPNKIKIYRFGWVGKNVSIYKRHITYFLYNFVTLFMLVVKRPERVLYFETLSSFPAVIYKLIFNKKSFLYIHYHEYTSEEEYRKNFIARHLYSLEKRIYPHVEWLSHTNEYRMKMFERNIAPIKISNKFVLPNYPPASWYCKPKLEFQQPVKIIYVGALGLDTMYVKEFTQWVINQEGTVEWDIYSFNYNSDVKSYFTSVRCPYIRFKEGVTYQSLPNILKEYDVGVILYKGLIPNYIYNAPNKLFEYLVCGLDVWFPDVMIGCMEYVQEEALQKVIPLSFTNLDNFELKNKYRYPQEEYKMIDYSCEFVLESLISRLIKH